MRIGGPALAVALSVSLLPSRARAVGTRTFELDSLERLSGGDLAGVTIGSDGVVRAGWTTGSVPLPPGTGDTVTCGIALKNGSIVVGTGPATGGKVVRFDGDQPTVLFDTKESAVNALAEGRGGVIYAGTTSNRVYRIAGGKADVLATLPDVDSVFALAIDPAGALLAGTGSGGTVFRIDPGGAASVLFKTDDPFVVALAVGSDGAVYAGTSGKGLVYLITGPGRATVLYDPPGEDVHALAIAPGPALYAIANEEPPTSSDSQDAPARRSGGGRSPAGPSTTPRAKPGKGSLWRFDSQGRPERMMHHDEFHYLALAVDPKGTPYVGTGAEGRVYTVDDAHEVALALDTKERQIGAVGVSTGTRFAIGSDPAFVHRVMAIGGADAVWTSKPLDAGLRARFGHLAWRATGTVETSTRTGDTPAPDSTWSAWSPPIADGATSPSPPGRFVQIRARLRDPSASISDVRLSFVTDNLRAVVTEIALRDKPREPKDGVPASGSEPPKHDTVVRLGWKVDNPDNDELRYRVQFRQENQVTWRDALESDDVLTKPELDWDTASLPEGKYRVSVDASDELANAPSEVTRHALESGPLLVDNTPPVFKSLGVQGRRLRGEVVDGLGPIARVEVALDGKARWRPIAPTDGIFDTADETFDVDLAPLIPRAGGSHIVAVRAYDRAGNTVVREVEAAP